MNDNLNNYHLQYGNIKMVVSFMKKIIALLILMSSTPLFAAYPSDYSALSPSPTQQRLLNEMSTQQQLHQQQLHSEQESSAQHLQQNNQYQQREMLNKLQQDQP